jgi:TRAP-type C4-dicarboxylate transport system permease small subunit
MAVQTSVPPPHREPPMPRALARAFDNVVAWVCCGFLTALLGCVSLGVVTRTLGEPLIWTDELSRFLMVWLAVFGWIAASRKRIHVRIRFFQDLLPRPAHRATELLIQAALTLFGALVAIYSVGLTVKNADLEATTLPISMAWMYAPMLLAGAVTAAQGAGELIETLRRPRLPAASEEVGVE